MSDVSVICTYFARTGISSALGKWWDILGLCQTGLLITQLIHDMYIEIMLLKLLFGVQHV